MEESTESPNSLPSKDATTNPANDLESITIEDEAIASNDQQKSQNSPTTAGTKVRKQQHQNLLHEKNLNLSSLDNVDNGSKEKIVAKRQSAEYIEELNRFKRRKIKIAGAPKMPLTGYVRYMTERRESLRREFPQKTAIEHTKMIGEEWQQLSEERKAPYLRDAEADKLRYHTELNVFLEEHPDLITAELEKNKQKKTDAINAKPVLKETTQQSNNQQRPHITNVSKTTQQNRFIENGKEDITPNQSGHLQKRTPTPTTNNGNVIQTSLPGEIPIFTNEFLDHNKFLDMEVRTLRKNKIDLEQQNAVLEKHVENMKFGVEKLATENDELQEKNRLLEVYLEKLKHKLATALAELALPTEPNGATVENIDKYMTDLYKMATSNTHGPATLNKAKDIIRKLDLQIQL